MDERAVITVHGPFEGLDRLRGRAPRSSAALRAEGRIVAEKRPYIHSVGHCSRCKTTIEPRLSLQWCVKVGAAGQGRGRRGPRRPGRRSTRRSWPSATSTGSTTCTTGASRGSCGGATGSRSGTAPTARSSASARTRSRRRRGLDARTPTSSTPGSPPACGRSPPSAGRSRPRTLAKFYPTSVLVTGYDILFFWVARMMMFGLYAMDGDRRRSTPSRCTAWSATSSARRCRSRSATRSTRWTGWTRTAPTRPASPWPRGANPGTDVAIGEDWVQAARATSPTRSGTPPASR